MSQAILFQSQNYDFTNFNNLPRKSYFGKPYAAYVSDKPYENLHNTNLSVLTGFVIMSAKLSLV